MKMIAKTSIRPSADPSRFEQAESTIELIDQDGKIVDTIMNQDDATPTIVNAAEGFEKAVQCE